MAALGELLVLTPEEISASVLTGSGQPSGQSSVRVIVRAPREILGSLRGSLAGRVELKPGGTGERDLSPDEVRWSAARAFDPEELDVSWKGAAPVRTEALISSGVSTSNSPRAAMRPSRAVCTCRSRVNSRTERPGAPGAYVESQSEGQCHEFLGGIGFDPTPHN